MLKNKEYPIKFEGDALWIDDKLVYRCKRIDNGFFSVLDTFQRNKWARSIKCPLECISDKKLGERFLENPKTSLALCQKFSDMLKKANKACAGRVRFRRVGSTIEWEIERQEVMRILGRREFDLAS